MSMQPFYARKGQILLKNPKSPADNTKVFFALPSPGIRRRLQFQPLISSAAVQVLSVDSVIPGQAYSLSRGTETATVLAAVGDTLSSLRTKLRRAINDTLGLLVYGVDTGTDDITLYGPNVSVPLSASLDLTLGPLTAGTDRPAGSTTINLSIPLVEEMQQGQFLTFRDVDGFETLVQLNARALPGDTTLIVKPLRRTLLAGAISEFPAYITNLTDASFTTSGTKSSSPDYNTSFEDGVVVTKSGSLTVPHNYVTRNAGAETLWYAYEKNLEVYWTRLFDPPELSFDFGLTYYGHGVVTTASDSAATGQSVTNELEVSFNEFFRLPPV